MLPLYPAARLTVGHERFASYFPQFSEIHTQSRVDPAAPQSKHQLRAAGESPQRYSVPALAGVLYRGLTGTSGR